ncbi:hypothetical protein B0J11DRAFT_86453 [Dendryphion nanum]|uniref:Uncharacterized protein n=1 Tax=Dendryphion nanum TaxID=256645 RepID=A0A9P9DH93_9PLEO|nr:hypothetical protein B0J11DRAFT_86453 [Dendryphion nanum]
MESVLFAFLLSALLTVGAIVYAYLSDSLPDWYLNETDKTVLSSIHSLLPSDESIQAFRTTAKRVILLGKRTKPSRKLSRSERQEAVTRFILALSDQQLATGLAILIAAISNQCTLTVYEFQVAFALAWFSCTTHLSTLDVLRDYLIKHGVVRNWRVFGMIVLLILLIYALIMTMASIDETIPVQCTFRYFGDRSINSSDPIDVYLVLAAVLTLALLVWNYIIRILGSYQRLGMTGTILERIVFSAKTLKLQRRHKPTDEEYDEMLIEAVLERRSRIRCKHLERIKASQGIRRHLFIFNRASKMYSESFLSLGPLIIFMVTYGFAQLYINRWHPDVPVTVDESMTFGQITPLFLLVLPIFAAAEIINEIKDASPEVNRIKDDKSIRRQEHQQTETDTLRRWNSLPASSGTEDVNVPLLHQGNSNSSDQLHDIERFFYREAKAVRARLTSATTSAEYKEAVQNQAVLLSQSRDLESLEKELEPTILTALLEFFVSSIFSLALALLLNVEGQRDVSTIASLVLFGIYMVYTATGLVADMKDAWLEASDSDYQRWLADVRRGGLDAGKVCVTPSLVTGQPYLAGTIEEGIELQEKPRNGDLKLCGSGTTQ